MRIKRLLSILAGFVLLCGGPAFATATQAGAAPPPLYVSPGASSGNSDTSCQTAVYSDIQSAVTAAGSGATIDVCPGTYQEYVTIPSSDTNLILKGINSSSGAPPVIVYPTTANPDTSTLKADPLVAVNGAAGVTIQGLEVSGPYHDTGCEANTASAPSHYGIYVGAGGSATINEDYVSEIRSLPSEGLNGCQDGYGVGVGNSGTSDTGTATVESTLIENYQKVGVRVDNGSNATVNGNTIEGVGPTSVIASNGVEMLAAATGTVENNNVGGNQYTGNNSGSGILLYGSGGVSVTDNTLSANDTGIYVGTPSAAVTVQGNQVTNDNTTTAGESDSEGIQLDGCATTAPASTTTCATGPTVTNNTISGGSVGIDVFDGTTGATVKNNTVTGAGQDGILDQGNTDGETVSSNYGSAVPAAVINTFNANSASGSGSFDCQDFTGPAAGTAGTDNTWTGDIGTTSSPAGICSSTPTTVAYAINAGGPQVSGTPTWAVDTQTSPSTFSNAVSSSDNNTYSSTAAITTNTTGAPNSVFQSCRYSVKSNPDMTWSFPVANGKQFEVELYFAEIYAPLFHNGGRVFNVSINGSPFLTNFDIYKMANGGDKAIVESSSVMTSTGTVTITFAHVTQNPQVNAIEILTN